MNCTCCSAKRSVNGFTTIRNAPVAEWRWLLSVTLAVNWNVPKVVGVPLMAPLLPRLKPGGSEPAAIDQVYGRIPPVAVSVAPAYGAFTVPSGRFCDCTVNAGFSTTGFTTI